MRTIILKESILHYPNKIMFSKCKCKQIMLNYFKNYLSPGASKINNNNISKLAKKNVGKKKKLKEKWYLRSDNTKQDKRMMIVSF